MGPLHNRPSHHPAEERGQSKAAGRAGPARKRSVGPVSWLLLCHGSGWRLESAGPVGRGTRGSVRVRGAFRFKQTHGLGSASIHSEPVWCAARSFRSKKQTETIKTLRDTNGAGGGGNESAGAGRDVSFNRSIKHLGSSRNTTNRFLIRTGPFIKSTDSQLDWNSKIFFSPLQKCTVVKRWCKIWRFDQFLNAPRLRGPSLYFQ